jgi:hypothetical protein
MTRTPSFLTLVILLGTSLPAQAAPIVVSAVDTVTFNFDFVAAGITPAPPYSGLVIEPASSQVDLGDTGTWTVYSGLNGTGGIAAGPIDLGLGLAFFPAGFPDMVDGIFSLVLTLTVGSITVDPFAYGLEGSQNVTGNVLPLQPTTAPEPATLTLLAGGLAVAAVRRRRRQR